MRRLLATAVLVAAMPTANAQDKGKSDFSTNAEFRARYFMMQNPGGNKDVLGSNTDAESRFKLGFGYKANEKVSATATLIHWAEFGQQLNTSAGAATATDTTTDTGATQDMVMVNQAFATWASSDDLKFNIGRMNYQVADGALIGINDWESMPYMFEGLLAKWEAEFGKFDFVAFKIRDVQAAGTATDYTASGNAQHNMYGINFDLKTMPEWMKTLNVHFFKNNGDAVVGTGGTGTAVATSTNGIDTMRYGLMAHFGFGDIELKAWYEGQGGKINNFATGGAKTEMDYSGSLMAAEVAYTAQNFMASRFHFLWHQDTGDKTTTGDKLEGYDGFFTEKHNSAGAMDLFGWGNLNFMQVGWMMKPTDNTDVGLQYSMFSVTEKASSFTAGRYGGNLPALAAQDTNKTKLGDEIDVWATHRYDSNLSTTLRVGYFMPGDRFEPAGANADAITHVMLEGRAAF